MNDAAFREVLPFPHSVLSQHIIVLGKTRSGKSSKMRLIVEELLARGEPTCIMDPKGDWWGLKSSATGKSAGFPIVIFGGEHGDVPLNAHAGASVAELVATGNRPCLIDLGGWMPGDRTRFFVDFAATFFRLTKGQRYLVIDEVHNFAPQVGMRAGNPDMAKMLHWANRLASEGSGKGVTLIAASQRPQKVSKDFITSCETLIACRVIHKLDRNAIKDWIDGCADAAVGREVLAELAVMERHEAWVWSPEVGFGPERISFPMFSTFDSFKPQNAQTTKLKGWASVDLEEVRGKLQAAIAEAEANDPAVLKKRIRELEKELADIPVVDAEYIDDKAIEAAAEQRGFAAGLEVGKRQFEELRGVAIAASIELYDVAQDICREGLKQLEARPMHPELPQWTNPADAPAKSSTGLPSHAAARLATRGTGHRAPPASMARRVSGDGVKLGRAERSILTVLAQHRAGRTKVQIAILSGYSSSSSTFDNALGALRSAGYATKGAQLTQITAEGLEALGTWEPLPSGRALIDHWLANLGKAERSILSACVERYPRAFTKQEIAETTGYSPSSSTFDNALGKLRTLELVQRGPEIRASEALFE